VSFILRTFPKLFSSLIYTVAVCLTNFHGIRWDQDILNQLQFPYLLPLAPF
jgi:hypothetical protein